MITIRDVAKLAGVSVATVSRVLNDRTNISQQAKSKVLEAIARLNYQPNANAQALASQNVDTIGVVVTDVTDAFFAILVKSVDQVAEKYQKNILIGIGYHNAEKERKAIDTLLRKRCTCLVVHAKALSDQALADYLRAVKGMVIINRVIPGFEHRCVALDNTKGTEIATETLIKCGHRCIGYIGSNHPIDDETERLQGYLNMLDKYHLPVRKLAITQASPNFEGGEEAMINLLSYNRDLTAVVAYNDSMASGAMSVLSENGFIVPKDFSIIGFDDMPIANHLIPKLTTIRYPIDLMAHYSAELALGLANDDIGLPKPIQFNPTLVRRFSVERRIN